MTVGTRLAVALVALVLVIAGAAYAQNGGLTALPPTDATQNLLQDGGFEATGAWRVRPEAAFNIDNGGRSGKALKMANADRDAGVAAADQSVTLEPGFYTIQGWVKTENVGTASPRTGVRLCLDGRPRVNWWK